MKERVMEEKAADDPTFKKGSLGGENAEKNEVGSFALMGQESGVPFHLRPTPNPLAASIPPSETSDFPKMASSSSLVMSLTRESSGTRLLRPTLDEGPPVKKLKLQSQDLTVGVRRESSESRRTPGEAAGSSSATPSEPSEIDESSAKHVSSASGASSSEGSMSACSLEPRNPGGTSTSEALTPNVTNPGTASSTGEKPAAAQHASLSSLPTPLVEDSDFPIKATKMVHLRGKYSEELKYMLKEFRKLERQLLGAAGSGAPVKETEGSRMRREKLHSFILHLEDSIRQIALGCQLEADGKSTVLIGVTVGEGSTSTAAMASAGGAATDISSEEARQSLANSSALSKLSEEKEEEENVQKLEEHILGNLLPVKQRLTKQLAAQQGASRNPVGMPASRRGMLQPSMSADKGKGTFAAAAEQKRKRLEAAQAESADDTQFGKPIVGGASSLTQKLHGSTLGSKTRIHGHGVGSSKERNDEPPTDSPKSEKKRNVLYAGMAAGSTQKQSGLSAASSVHKVTFETSALLPPPSPLKVESSQAGPDDAIQTPIMPDAKTMAARHAAAARAAGLPVKEPGVALSVPVSTLLDGDKKRSRKSPPLEDDERKKLLLKKKKKRKKQQQRHDAKARERERHLQMIRKQQSAPAKTQGKRGKGGGAKGQGKKKGPRAVEYICVLCSETYGSTCDANPWWALTSHDCPKCRKTQIPRVDISARANQIEYHPALLAHADDGNASGTSHGGSMGVMEINPAHLHPHPVPRKPQTATSSDSDSDLSDISLTGLSDDSSYNSDLDFPGGLTPADQAENEEFGSDYTGPKFTEYESARLLVLMEHASSCPGRHKHLKQRDVCRSVKYMMLHARDCPGTTSTYDVCPFPWCRKVKHLLGHLVSCTGPTDCAVCSPPGLSPNLRALIGLSRHRRQKLQERRSRAMAVAAAAARATPASKSRGGRIPASGCCGSTKNGPPTQVKLSDGSVSSVSAQGTISAIRPGAANLSSKARAAAGYHPPSILSSCPEPHLSQSSSTSKPSHSTASRAVDPGGPNAAVRDSAPDFGTPIAYTIAAAQDTIDSVLPAELLEDESGIEPISVTQESGARQGSAPERILPLTSTSSHAETTAAFDPEEAVVNQDVDEIPSDLVAENHAATVPVSTKTDAKDDTPALTTDSGMQAKDKKDEVDEMQSKMTEECMQTQADVETDAPRLPKDDDNAMVQESKIASSPVAGAEKASTCSEEVVKKTECVRMSY